MGTTQVAIGLNKQAAGDTGWETGLDAGIDAANTRLTLTFAGDPNGNVIGSWVGQQCYDTTNDRRYYCTTVGDAVTAVWTQLDWNKTGAGKPTAVNAEFIGQRYFDTTDKTWHTATAAGTPGTWFQEIPVGTIAMWSGTIGNIPAGWIICDGTLGTPNLKGRFVVGFDSGDVDYDTIANTGGEKAHTLTVAEMPAHTHVATGDVAFGVGNNFTMTSTVGEQNQDTTESTGGDGAHESRPPYFVLAYIYKK